MSDGPQQMGTPDEGAAAAVGEPDDGALDAESMEGADEQIAFDLSTFPGGARSAIEAVLMVVDEPVTEMSLASALELPVEDVLEHLHTLEEQYAADERGFTLRSVAGGWRGDLECSVIGVLPR